MLVNAHFHRLTNVVRLPLSLTINYIHQVDHDDARFKLPTCLTGVASLLTFLHACEHLYGLCSADHLLISHAITLPC
jgi:hypothetical protein